ncbi:MAG: AAA family ATPase, partial [Myxococcales bacterium]|nr:AAA family ATPase [Myxococcales bacterium]
QHLVNRRSEQAFAREGGDDTTANEIKIWFEQLRAWLARLLDHPELQLRFDAKTFEFSLLLDDGEVSFQTLPDGFASALSLWSEIFLRAEAIEGEASGWVLIDEPELHLHPELQEQLLPFLTQQFPNLQFIVATHSPMVATSLANATVYDLELRRPKRGDELQGYRYGNILKSHFGLRTDFDAATTAKLERLHALNHIDQRSDEQDAERRR